MTTTASAALTGPDRGLVIVVLAGAYVGDTLPGVVTGVADDPSRIGTSQADPAKARSLVWMAPFLLPLAIASRPSRPPRASDRQGPLHIYPGTVPAMIHSPGGGWGHWAFGATTWKTGSW